MAVFGPRAYDIRNGNAAGSIDCLVEEARIYNMAMGQADIRQLSLVDAAPFEIVITDATVDGDGFFELTWNSRPGDLYQVALETQLASAPNTGGSQNEAVRCDMVYFEGPNGGAVFSVGSISWCSCLSYRGGDNNVSRVTENVLRAFAADG